MSQKYTDLSADLQNVFGQLAALPFQGISNKLASDFEIIFAEFQQDMITAAELNDNLYRVITQD